jgi:hypothetical protein
VEKSCNTAFDCCDLSIRFLGLQTLCLDACVNDSSEYEVSRNEDFLQRALPLDRWHFDQFAVLKGISSLSHFPLCKISLQFGERGDAMQCNAVSSTMLFGNLSRNCDLHSGMEYCYSPLLRAQVINRDAYHAYYVILIFFIKNHTYWNLLQFYYKNMTIKSCNANYIKKRRTNNTNNSGPPKKFLRPRPLESTAPTLFVYFFHFLFWF